jgi:hypothetical protein
MSRERSYTDEEFIDAINTSRSKRQALLALGLKAAGGNYKCLDLKVQELGLDTSHWKGKSWNKGLVHGPRRPVQDYLTENSTFQSHKLRIKLFEQGLKEKVCESCGLTEWLGKPISLELDHINGNNTDNRIENLRILCPNCHAQTETYRGKNKSRRGVRVVDGDCLESS